MNTKLKRLKKGVQAIVIAAMVFGLLAFAAPARVYASNGVEETPPPTQNVADPDRLERVYQKLINLSKRQEENLGRIDEKIADVSERIAALKVKGKDVSVLEEALDSYQAKLNEGKGLHADAAAILDEHAGFDAAGKVVDADAAKETLKTAGELMREARQGMRPAFQALLKVLREFRRDNR
jgi:hypothetical protein